MPIRHLALLFAALSLVPAARAETVSHDVRYTNGDIILAAELILPDGDGPHPAVVIAQGSGESDRSNGWARAIAAIFRDRGLAVLLTDKRGSGASGGDWRSAAFTELAADARAGAAYLRTRRDIDSARIGVAGLSQGGKYAPLVAVSDARIAFVVSISADAVTYGEQAFHEMSNMARERAMPDAAVDGGVRLAAAAARHAVSGDWAPYAAERAAAVGQPWEGFLAALPATPDDPQWTFWRVNGSFDPMAYWPIVRQPALVLLGADDERENVAVAETARRLHFGFAQARKTDQRVVVLPGVGHDVGVMAGNPAASAAIDDFLRAYKLCTCPPR